MLAVRQYYRVTNPDAEDYTRVGQWVDVVTHDDDPDIDVHIVLRMSDNKLVAFRKDELETYRPWGEQS